MNTPKRYWLYVSDATILDSQMVKFQPLSKMLIKVVLTGKNQWWPKAWNTLISVTTLFVRQLIHPTMDWYVVMVGLLDILDEGGNAMLLMGRTDQYSVMSGLVFLLDNANCSMVCYANTFWERWTFNSLDLGCLIHVNWVPRNQSDYPMTSTSRWLESLDWNACSVIVSPLK